MFEFANVFENQRFPNSAWIKSLRLTMDLMYLIALLCCCFCNLTSASVYVFHNISMECGQSLNVSVDDGVDGMFLRFEIEQTAGPQTVDLGIYQLSPSGSFNIFGFKEEGDESESLPINVIGTNESDYQLVALGDLSPSNYIAVGLPFGDVDVKFELNCTNIACISDTCC